MANVLCVIELSLGKALPVCLEALGQARRLSTALGATLYAVVPLEHAPRYGEDDLIAVLARHGADKVVLVTDEAVGATEGMRWGTHGAAIGMASDLLPPSLLLFGATAGGREVAPRAAARMGAAYLTDAWLEVKDDRLALYEGQGSRAQLLDGELEFPVVATVPPGRYAIAAGDEEAEVEVLISGGRAPDLAEIGWEADPLGQVVVLAPEGGAELAEAAQALERALGATALAAADRAAENARLAISLGPPLDGSRALERVALGEGAEKQSAAHYALSGPTVEVARAVAEAIAEEDEAPRPARDPDGTGA
jgi:electron transfer flavoprotein alpha subunit